MTFAAETTANLEIIKLRLGGLTAGLATAEAAAPQAALRQELGTATPEDEAVLATLAGMRQRRASLTLALEAAEQAEAARQAEAQNKEQAARHRACRQHAARIDKETLRAASAAEALVNAYAAMIQAARSLNATLTPRDQQRTAASTQLSPTVLAKFLAVELCRLAQAAGVEPIHPVSMLSFTDTHGRVTPLTELIGTRTSPVKTLLGGSHV